MRKTIFLDLQNTILGGISHLNQEQKEMINILDSKHNLFIASNVYPSDMAYFNELNGLNLNFIAGSGSFIKYKDNYQTASFKADLSLFNNYLSDLIFLFYEKNYTFYIYGYQTRLRTLYPIKPKDTKIIDNFNDYKIDTYDSILLCINKNSKMLSHLFKQDSIHLEIIGQDQTKVIYLILKKNVNKAYFIPTIYQKLNIDFNDTISAGDSVEDLCLYNHTKLKLAPINGCQEIKDKADIIVSSYLDNGILKYLVNNT